MIRGLAAYIGRHHVALLALLVAMGGTSYAAVNLPRDSVGPQQLKARAVTTAKLGNGAVTSAKVRDGSLLAADFRRGQLPAGAQGPPGATGAAGPQGPAGIAGPAGVSGYERIQTTVNVSPGDTSVVTSASCPAGKTLLGGGGAVQESKLHITFLFPQSNNVMGLTAVLIPGQTITGSSQAFVVALCGNVD